MMVFANTRNEGVVVLATHRLAGGIENLSIEEFVAGLKGDFEVTKFEFDSPDVKTEAQQKMLRNIRGAYERDKNALGIYSGDGCFYAAELKNKEAMDSVAKEKSRAWKLLDVSVLHKLVLEKLLGIDETKLAGGGYVEYVKDTFTAIDESIAKVESGEKQLAFFMNPPKIEQIQKVSEAGEKMPQKSTYFYPKMYTGLTINKL